MINPHVRVLVLGGRLTPSLVAVLSDPPDAIEFIVSRDTPERYEQARNVLAEPLEGRLPASPLPAVSPFDWQSCQERCLDAVARHPAARFTFDVTTAPKFMSFAVQAFGKDHGHEVVMVDTAGAREVSLINRQARSVALPRNVKSYLKLFGRELKPKLNFSQLSIGEHQATQIARELAWGGEVAAQALNKFNRWTAGRCGALVTSADGETVGDDELAVFGLLAEYRLITHLQRKVDGQITYHTSPNPVDTRFVAGTWLEVYIWNEARMLRHWMTGEPLFSNCHLGFEIPHFDGQKREVDMGCLYQGQLIHCSCKARAPRFSFDKHNLDEMVAVSDLLGGNFTTRVFVTNAFQPHDAEQWAFVKHAEKHKIVLVTGDDLPKVGEVLYQQAVEPKYARI